MIKDDCNNCENFALYPYSTTCLECGGSPKNRKPITNADRIRRMTDDELAMFIAPLASCPECYARRVNIEDCGYDCKKAWLDWLRQEAQ